MSIMGDMDVIETWILKAPGDIKMIQLWMGGKQLCQMEIARLVYECDTL